MKRALLFIAMLLAAATSKAQTAMLPHLELQQFSQGYDQPLGIENAGDSRLFIVERTGKIWICGPNGNKFADPFLDISDRITSVSGEQGLLGLAFDPDYSANGYFYVDYTNKDGNTRVSRFEVQKNNPDLADGASELIILRVPQPFMNHNGGCLRFSEGYLYISLGDGGAAADPYNTAQDLTRLLGKILRIDVTHGSGVKNYSIPPTNPYVGNTNSFREEIWASGLRNPWRFSFDALTDNMWIGDVGQDEYEEINMQPAGLGGLNYGWSCWEGAHFFKDNCNPNYVHPTFPVMEYEHVVSPACGGTVIGGFVYRGNSFPRMYGKYIYVDFCTGDFRTVFKIHGIFMHCYLTSGDYASYTSFGEDVDNELYVANAVNGKIYLLVDASVSQKPFAPAPVTGLEINSVALFPNPNTGEFTLQVVSPSAKTCNIEITNQVGQKVFSEIKKTEKGLNEWTFSSDKFTKGVYFLFMKNAEGTIEKKFVVQ